MSLDKYTFFPAELCYVQKIQPKIAKLEGEYYHLKHAYHCLGILSFDRNIFQIYRNIFQIYRNIFDRYT